ncbi:MAG: hypothetical protein F4W92_05175 [Gammaproteobacteria bacterium]|nr:hypothetical protein [Gammaproteobacteria bacterium]
MQNLFSRSLILLAGLLIGILGVTGVLVLLPENGTSSDSQQLENQTRNNDEGNVGSISQVSSDSVPTDLNDLIFPKQAFDQKMSILSWVQALSEDQILDWLQQSIEPSWNVSDSNRTELQSALLQKLSMTAPKRAFEFTWSDDDQSRYSMAYIVLRTWANVDLEGAIAHVNELGLEEYSYLPYTILEARDDLNFDQLRDIARELGDESYAFANHFQNLAEGQIEDPKQVWYEIINLANREGMQEATEYALSRVAVAWVEKEGRQIFDEIVSSISSDSKYDYALSQIFGELAEDEPEEIFEYMLTNLGDNALEIIQQSRVAYKWASRDPRGLLSKIEMVPASRVRRNMISNAVYQWSANNPQQLLNNLELVPQEQRENASRSAIRTLARTSPSEAAKYVLQVSDYSTQVSIANTLVREWSYKDAEAAEDWVYSISDNERLRSALIRPLVRALVGTDPRKAFQLALEQPISEQTDTPNTSLAFEASILSSIAYNDLDLAIELLPQVRDSGHSKVNAYSSIGSFLIENGETQKAMNLASQLSVEQQTQYYERLASSWILQDPKGLLTTIEDFPTNEIKSRIAVSINLINRMMQTYSADELASVDKYISEEDRKKLEAVKDIDLMNPSEEELELLEELFPY